MRLPPRMSPDVPCLSWLVSRPGWQKLSAGLDANRAVLVALEGTAMLMAWAVALCPFGILVAWASIFFRSNSLPPLYGVLVLLGGVGLLFGVWAVLLWRQAGFSPRARPPATAAAAAAFFLTAFVTGAAFSGGGTGIFRYTTDGLFFAIMSLAFGLSLVPLVPLATIAGTPANGGLSAFAERAFAAMSTGAPAPPWHTGGAQAGGDAPGCQGVLAQRARAVPLFVAAQLLSLSGALAFALLAEGNRGTGFVAAGAVIVADAAGALAWNSGLVLHRAPGTYLVAAGVARGSVLLFPVSRWFLGHALLFALVASALASAAAARRWPLRDAATRRREELADTLNTLRVLAPHHSKVGEGAQRSTFPLTKCVISFPPPPRQYPQTSVAATPTNAPGLTPPALPPHCANTRPPACAGRSWLNALPGSSQPGRVCGRSYPRPSQRTWRWSPGASRRPSLESTRATRSGSTASLRSSPPRPRPPPSRSCAPGPLSLRTSRKPLRPSSRVPLKPPRLRRPIPDS